MPGDNTPIAYRFGLFRLDVRDRILERNGERVPLTPKVIDTLFVLIERRGEVVSKDDLLKAVWPDVTVVESGLTRNLSVLRKAIEEDGAEGSWIETIPKRGYRFVGEVELELPPVAESAAALPPEPPLVQDVPQRPRAWMVPSAVILMIALAATIYALRARRTAPVEPLVRIGEHHLYKLTPSAMERAAAQFEQAIAANPKSSGAHAGLAIALLGLIDFGARPPAEAAPAAASAARRAVALDPASCTAHSALGLALLLSEWNIPAADDEFRKALHADSQSVQARLLYARLKIATAKLDDARRLIEEALALDPASPPLGAEYCRVFYYMRDYHRAEAECRKVLDREPGFALAHYYLALSLGLSGRTAEARQSLRDSGLRPEVIEADLAWLSALEGDPQPARAVLEARRKVVGKGGINASANLLPAATLGLVEEAWEAFDAAIANRAPETLNVPVEPRLDAVRRDPRYARAIARLGLNP